MSTFDHATLMKDINANLAPFRQSQSEAMGGFAKLAQASMAEGAISAKHKEPSPSGARSHMSSKATLASPRNSSRLGPVGLKLANTKPR